MWLPSFFASKTKLHVQIKPSLQVKTNTMHFLASPYLFKFQYCIIVWWNVHCFMSSLLSLVSLWMYSSELAYLTSNFSSLKLLEKTWVSFNARCYLSMNSFESPSHYSGLVRFFTSQSPFTSNTITFSSLLYIRMGVSYVLFFGSQLLFGHFLHIAWLIVYFLMYFIPKR
jgi:hypothetical protein